MQMEIKSITENELAELYALRQNVLRIPLGLNLFNEDLSIETGWLKFGAYIDNRIVGCVMLTPLSVTTVKLRQMCVYNALQGKGIGKKLVLHAEKWVQENGFKKIELHARDVAQGFYTKLEYKNIGDIFLEVGIGHQKMIKEFE